MQSRVKLKVKKLAEGAFVPKYSYEGDACIDLVAIDSAENHDFGYIEYGTGLAVEIPEGHVGLIYPRSSISKTCHSLANSVGVIDSNYRGELKVRMRYDSDKDHLMYMYGDKIAQLMVVPLPQIDIQLVDELSNSTRGGKGFGSSDEITN